MAPETLLALLSARNTDPAVEAMLDYFRVRNRPVVELDEDDSDGPVVDTQSWVKNSHAGIEFGFDDEAAWQGVDETLFGTGPMILTQIYFYGRREGVRSYAGALPFGLKIDDGRARVRERMNRHEATRHSHVRDTWDTTACRVTVSYVDDQSMISFVLCALREPPLPSLGYLLAHVPKGETLVKLLGSSLDDPATKTALDPLGLGNRIAQIEETGEADLLNPYGLSASFAVPAKKTRRWHKDILLVGMTFYQERERGARRWPGEMPYGVTFDDAPEMVIQKVGRAPDDQKDEDFSGYAIWNEPDLTFHVLYNTMDNRVMRVSMLAPGVSKEPGDE